MAAPLIPAPATSAHLREQGLVRTERLDGHWDHVVVLTDRGRDLLHAHRVDRQQEHRQTFRAGLVKPREVEHDLQVYQAYLREAEKLADHEASIDRIVLDYELKREYQQWLHERDAERGGGDGRPNREPRRSRNGPTNTTCRTSTSRSIFQTCASSTRGSTVATIMSTSRCSPPTIAVPTARRRPAQASVRIGDRACGSELRAAVAAGAAGAWAAWPRSS
jgi:hypothetical protein